MGMVFQYKHYKGEAKPIPGGIQNKKGLDSTYLIYRHKISVRETQWRSGLLDYTNVEVTLDRVKLGTWEEGLMKK